MSTWSLRENPVRPIQAYSKLLSALDVGTILTRDISNRNQAYAGFRVRRFLGYIPPLSWRDLQGLSERWTRKDPDDSRFSASWTPDLRSKCPLFQRCQSLMPKRVVVKIMVPSWVPVIVRHLIFRVPKKGP